MPAGDVAARLRELEDEREGQGFNTCLIGSDVCSALRELADVEQRTTSGYLRALADAVDERPE